MSGVGGAKMDGILPNIGITVLSLPVERQNPGYITVTDTDAVPPYSLCTRVESVCYKFYHEHISKDIIHETRNI